MIDIFVDSGPLFAFCTPRDITHQRTREFIDVIKQKNWRMVTTDYVISESLTTLITSRKGGYLPAITLIDWLFKKPAVVHIEWIHQNRFFATITIFHRYNKDKLWSFTDCTSYVVMRELGIKTAFTFDEHFQQMGFKLLK